MHLDQTQAGELFGNAIRGKPYEFNYISMLETQKKDVPEKWIKYIARFESELEPKIDIRTESAKLHEPQAPYLVQPTREACEKHLHDFLSKCEDDPAKLGWTLTELRDKFPLNKWKDK